MTPLTKKEEIVQQAVLTIAHDDYSKTLNKYAFFKIHDHMLCDDLVQDTFLKTWKYLAKGGKINIMKAFLYHILNNLIIDEYRKHKTTSLEILVEKGFEPSTEDFRQVFNVLDGKKALLLIQRLPETYRKIMRMKYLQDLTLKEMSLLTGKTRNTMAVQVHRGLEKLKVMYEAGL